MLTYSLQNIGGDDKRLQTPLWVLGVLHGDLDIREAVLDQALTQTVGVTNVEVGDTHICCGLHYLGNRVFLDPRDTDDSLLSGYRLQLQVVVIGVLSWRAIRKIGLNLSMQRSGVKKRVGCALIHDRQQANTLEIIANDGGRIHVKAVRFTDLEVVHGEASL